jgi:hypothetical protein
MDSFLKFLKAAGKKAAGPVLGAAVYAGLDALGAPAWLYDAVGSLFSLVF